MEKKKFAKLKRFLFIVISIFLIFLFFAFLYTQYEAIDIDESEYKSERTLSTNNEENVENIKENSENISDMIEKSSKSVVGISKLKNTGTSIFSKNSEENLGLGTGVIVTSDGYILSNEHVTGTKYSKCYITIEDGTNYDGTVVWSDSDLDISITKIDAKDLNFCVIGDSGNIKVGQTVYAIGNPIGFEFMRTVTSGIISAKERTIKIEEENSVSYMSDLIQTDATINPGNSGGPLLNPNGEVIGITTVKISTAEGIGFAVPINVIKNVVQSFKNTGGFEEASIGIYAYDKSAIPYLTSNSTNFEKGIYVEKITVNGPASTTELKQEDIINSIDNKELNTMNELREYIYTKKPGDTVNLKVTRGKIVKTIEVVLGKK